VCEREREREREREVLTHDFSVNAHQFHIFLSQIF
jgi:hypothetical protein